MRSYVTIFKKLFCEFLSVMNIVHMSIKFLSDESNFDFLKTHLLKKLRTIYVPAIKPRQLKYGISEQRRNEADRDEKARDSEVSNCEIIPVVLFMKYVKNKLFSISRCSLKAVQAAIYNFPYVFLLR